MSGFTDRLLSAFDERCRDIGLHRLCLVASESPLRQMRELGRHVGHDSLWVKLDSRIGDGGSKCRALEFILGEAERKGTRTLSVTGLLESNFARATAHHGRALGFEVILRLFAPRTLSKDQVSQILGRLRASGATVDVISAGEYRWRECQANRSGLQARFSRDAMTVPVGGASTTGVVGYARAVCELRDQVVEGGCPEPSELFVPVGSGGLLAGLAVGITMLRSKSMRVTGAGVCAGTAARQDVESLAEDALSLLQGRKGVVPPLSDHTIVVSDEFYEAGYGIATPSINQACDLLAATEGIRVDHVYASKALLAFLRRARSPLMKNRSLLLWLTREASDAHE